MANSQYTLEDIQYTLLRNRGKTLLRFRISYDNNKTWQVIDNAALIDFDKMVNIIVEFSNANPIFLKHRGK